jgi:hypothetical protein
VTNDRTSRSRDPGQIFASVTSTPYDFATYRDVNEPLTPDDIVFVVGGRSIRNRLHVLEESDLGLAEECGDDPNTKQTLEYIQSMCNAR